MSNLEQPPPSSAHFPPEKSPGNAIPGPSTVTTNCTPSSTEHKPDDRHAKIMENFKGMIFKFAVSSSSTKPLSSMQRSLIEQRLDKVFPSFRTPDHPPYNAMIEAAIKKLSEEGAASEEGISQFIRKECPDLPWAHDTILKYHLGNLCENGSIVKTSNGLYMHLNVVSNQDFASPPASSPCSSINAYSSFSPSADSSCSSSFWSDSSYCCSPRPKRKGPKRRKKQGRRRGSKNKSSNEGKVNRIRRARVAKRRRRRPVKRYVSEDETETSDEHLMLEEESEETEADNESEEECNEGVEGISQVRGKKQRIRKQNQRQETGLMIEIELDNHVDMVDEGQREIQTRGMKGRKAHLKSTRVVGKRRGRLCKEFLSVEKTQPYVEEMETDIQYLMKIEVPKEEYRINKELANEVENHDQGSIHETLESSRAEDTCTVSKIGKSESVGKVNKPIKLCNFVMQVVPKNDEGVEERGEQKEHDNFEGIEEQSQLEEYNKMPDQDHRNGQKRRGRPPKTSLKRRKVQPKPKHIPGRPRGRPRKKDLSVEKILPNEGQMDTTNIQDPILEKKTDVPVQKYDTNKEVTEVVEVPNQSQGNLCETHEKSPVEEIEMMEEVEKSGLEEKKLIKQFNLVMEGDLENDEGAKGCVGQKEHEKFPQTEDKTQFEEPNTVRKQDQGNGQKRRGKLLNKDTKDREVHMKHSRIPGRGRGRPRKKDILVEKTQANAEQTETTDSHEALFKENTEVPNENCGINKESTEVVEDCSELKGNMHETSEWSPVEKIKIVKEVGKPGLVVSDSHEAMFKENAEIPDENCGINKESTEIVEDCSELKGNMHETSEWSPAEKIRTVKEVRKPGLVVSDSHEAMFKENTEVPEENCGINKESTEVVEDYSELKGNMHETSEWSPVENIKIVKEVRKPGLVAEESLQEKQDCCVKDEEQQQDWGLQGLNEQSENENAFDEEPYQSTKEQNEMTFGKHQPKREENEEQNQQLEKGLMTITEKEVDMPEMIGQDPQIQENIQSGGQYESITKTLLSVDVAQRSMDCKAIVLPEESFNSVLREGKEISNKSMEQQRGIPREEKVLKIDGWQREAIEQKPESSTAANSQLKSVERSSQPQYLFQQEPEEEKLLDGKLRSNSPNSCNLCRVL